MYALRFWVSLWGDCSHVTLLMWWCNRPRLFVPSCQLCYMACMWCYLTALYTYIIFHDFGTKMTICTDNIYFNSLFVGKDCFEADVEVEGFNIVYHDTMLQYITLSCHFENTVVREWSIPHTHVESFNPRNPCMSVHRGTRLIGSHN